MARNDNRVKWPWPWPAALLFAAGCGTASSKFQVMDYRAGKAQQYQETFREGFYGQDRDGNVNVVLQRSDPNPENPRDLVTQIVHLKSFWRSIPGQTVAEATQLNGLVTYAILVGERGATFEGAGSMFFQRDPWTGVLNGTLEHASLKPTRRLDDKADVFQQAHLTGTFHAKKDGRRALRMANEIARKFGPLPAYQPRATK